MEAQRLEVLERKLKRMERLIRGVVAGWILSILGILVFGLITRPVFREPAPPRVLTVHGIRVVDDQGHEHASIDAQGEIKGSVLRGGGLVGGTLQIGSFPHGGLFEVSSFTSPDGHPIIMMQMTTAETRHTVFTVQTGPGASLSLGRVDPADYVQLTETGIEVARRGRIIWHAP